MKSNKICFMIMPFSNELHYFFLYLQKHLHENHNIELVRADNSVLTIPLLEKINQNILNSDLLIADITGRNPNVFYELGLAHAYGKKIILITNDSIEKAPSDIRHYEFIKYDLTKHIEFLSKLDNAIHNVFIQDIKRNFNTALRILKKFNKEMNIKCAPTSLGSFHTRFLKAERTQKQLDQRNKRQMKEFLLPIIIEESTKINIMEKITEWIKKK